MSLPAASAFVGREAELARLLQGLEEIGRREALAVVVDGESGAGKTRLLREFAAVAAERGATVLSGRCLDCGDAGPPYWAFVEALRPLIDADAPTAGAGEPEADPGSSAGGTGFFTVVLDRLEAAARRSPVVLLVDDLHWADRSTRDLLGFVLANLAGGPGPLVVTTVRREALLPGHPLVPLLAELRRSRRAEFMSLDRLGRADVAALVASIVGASPEPELLEEVWRRSEGNPFFVEELIPALRAGHEPTSRLQPVLAARLSALSSEGRAAAGAVAVAIGPVPHPILAEVAGLPDEALRAGLRECVDHHLLVVDAGAGTYAFRHGLLKDAAGAGLLPGDVVRLHAAYGRALQAAAPASGPGSSAPSAADLAAEAWHLYAAGDARAALPATLAAARAAEAAGGHAEAQVQYERALELAGRLPPDALEAAFMAEPGPSAARPGGRDGGGEVVGRPPETAVRRSGGGEGRGRADRTALAERAAEAALLAGDPAGAVRLLGEALAGAGEEAGARLHLAFGRARWAAGDSRAALADYDRAVSLLADAESAEGVRVMGAAAEAWMLAGRYEKSRRLAEDGLARARRLGMPVEEAEILGTLGADLAHLGEAETALAALDGAVAVTEKAARPGPLARAWLNRAEVLAGPLNRLADAASVAAAGMEGLHGLGLDRSYGAALAAVLANTLFRAGHWDDADPVIETALATRPTGVAAVELLLARARLAVGRGDFTAGHADLARIDRRWTQAVAPRHRAPLLTLAAGLALWEGRIDGAREAVARALELLADSEDVWLVAPVVWHGLRAEGDRAERARALGDHGGAAAAADAAADLLGRAEALRRGAAPAVLPVVAAYEALCRAESSRAVGSADPEAWADAALRWDALAQPYPSAYARFREGEATLAARSRSTRAAAALQAAHGVARRLGARPLGNEIEALARRARIPLPQTAGRPPTGSPPTGSPAAEGPTGSPPAGSPGAEGPTGSPPAGGPTAGAPPTEGPPAGGRRPEPAGPEPDPDGSPLGTLSPREREVLSLVAEGRSNRQIAAALFIAEKTASVHVSHILAKLGVRSRVQAAALAHRVGSAGHHNRDRSR